LADDEGDRKNGAETAHRCRRKDDVAAEFAQDAVAGVGEGEVAEAVHHDAAGTIERRVEG
jgi:hypothetical protein